MYTIHKKLEYKYCVCLGIFGSIVFGLISCYHYVSVLILFSFFFIYTIYSIVRLFLPRNNYIVLRIDDDGVYLCERKDQGVFIPWMKVRYFTFVVDYRVFKIAIRTYDKKSHYLLFNDYPWQFKLKGIINAAKKYTDNKSKIFVAKDSVTFTYENSMHMFLDYVESQKKNGHKDMQSI